MPIVNLYEDVLKRMERDREFQYQKEQQEKRDAENQRRFELELARQKAADARAAETHRFNQKLNAAKLAELERAQLTRDYNQRDYDPLAEGLGTLRSGGNFSKLPVDQQEAVGIHYDAYRTDGSNTMDDDSIRQFALDRSLSGEDDRFQGHRNAEYRKTLADREAAALKNKKGMLDKDANAILFTAAANKLLAENPQRFKGIDKDNTYAVARAYYDQRKELGKPVSEENALRYALGDASTTATGGNEIFFSDIKSLYGKQFDNLDEKEKADLTNLIQDFAMKKNRIDNLVKSGKIKKDSIEYLNALRGIDKSWTNKDFASPVRDEIHNLEYAELVKELDAQEKALAAKHPRRYKWVKDNQDASIGGWKMNQNLAPTKAEEEASGYQRYFGKEHALSNAMVDYHDFLADLTQLQKVRNALTDRERWVAQNSNKRNVGK